MPTILFCADPLDPRHIDPHFRAEAETVRDHGGTVALLDHDALRHGDPAAAVRRVAPGLGAMWYRGWMVTWAEYTALAAALRARDCDLVVRPDDYRRAHELPGWHDTFAGLTPRSVWTPAAPSPAPPPSHLPPAPDELAALVRPLRPGPAVVKDYVKSRKHEWDQACFVPDLTDTTALHRVVTRMFELQDGHLSGGLVVREYEPYDRSGEIRVWWIDGEPVHLGAHPDTPAQPAAGVPDATMNAVKAAVRALGCRFITTDLARLSDTPAESRWRVVEVGDGQVSDLAETSDHADLYAFLP